MVIAIKIHRGISYWLTRFVKNPAADQSLWGKFEHEMFGIETRTGHYRSRVLIVLFVSRRDKSSLGTSKRKLSRRHIGEFEFSIVESNDGLLGLASFGVGKNHTSSSQRMTICF